MKKTLIGFGFILFLIIIGLWINIFIKSKQNQFYKDKINQINSNPVTTTPLPDKNLETTSRWITYRDNINKFNISYPHPLYRDGSEIGNDIRNQSTFNQKPIFYLAKNPYEKWSLLIFSFSKSTDLSNFENNIISYQSKYIEIDNKVYFIVINIDTNSESELNKIISSFDPLKSSNFSDKFTVIEKSLGYEPKEWIGLILKADQLATDLIQIVSHDPNSQGSSGYFEYWTNNRTGKWQLLGRFNPGQQGLHYCEDWEKLKVAKGMECTRWMGSEYDFNSRVSF